jgi:hypothetical protein
MAGTSLARAARLLIGLRWRRVRNRLLTRGWNRRGGRAAGLRGGTAAKSRNSWLFALFVGIYIPIIAFQQGGRVLTEISQHEMGMGRWLVGDALPAAVLHDTGIELAILMAAALLSSLGNRELSAPEWDLEWTATLPVPSTALLGVRILERAVVNPAGFVALWPFSTVLAWRCGFGAAAPFLAAAVSLALMISVATAWTVIETALRVTLAPQRLRNLQAMISLASVASLFLALAPVAGMVEPLQRLGRVLPELARWTPFGLAVCALSRRAPMAALADTGLLMGQALMIAAVGLAWLSRILRDGLVASGGRESARRSRAVPPRPARAAIVQPALAPPGLAQPAPLVAGEGQGTVPRRAWLTVIQRRELRLLGRDRNFLVQTLAVPLLIVGAQIFFRLRLNGHRGAMRAMIGPAHAAAAAFGISAYAIMFSAFQTINAEGHALWILYTLPHRLERLLRQKAALWACVSLIFPVAWLALFFYANGGLSLRALALAGIALVGVPIHALMATALGVFASDPLSNDTGRRLRPAYVYLYMALAGLYTYALYGSGIWQRGALMVLSALVALALWQKAGDQLPYLLDPAASPVARVSLADGLIAAMLFFVAQALIGAGLLASAGGTMDGAVLTKAFVWAGALTFAIMRFAFWRTHATGVPRLRGPGVARAVALGLAGAGLASVLGTVYLLLLRRLGRLPAMDGAALAAVRPWLIPLAVVAAPLFEEFIFRGLIFGGLRRTFTRGWAALASAAIFAIVHPPLSMAPVFCLGWIAALVYDRAGMLLAPMLVHAGYNAAVTILQPLLAR